MGEADVQSLVTRRTEDLSNGFDVLMEEKRKGANMA